MKKERANKSVVPFSVGYVLAVLCPSSHPPRQHGIGPEADTRSNRQNNIRFHLACLLKHLEFVVCNIKSYSTMSMLLLKLNS